jgi:hypothetical protein
LRGIGVTAAALLVAFLVGFAVRGGGDDRESAVRHTCAATDLRFIETAKTNMTALGIWAAGYKSGEIEPEEVAKEARGAAKRVGYVDPMDPSLRHAQKLMNAMFTEYGEAVALYAKGKDAGERMYRAYGLANFAREVLLEAQPELAKHGCDVGPLL